MHGQTGCEILPKVHNLTMSYSKRKLKWKKSQYVPSFWIYTGWCHSPLIYVSTWSICTTFTTDSRNQLSLICPCLCYSKVQCIMLVFFNLFESQKLQTLSRQIARYDNLIKITNLSWYWVWLFHFLLYSRARHSSTRRNWVQSCALKNYKRSLQTLYVITCK